LKSIEKGGNVKIKKFGFRNKIHPKKKGGEEKKKKKICGLNNFG
jgi:hypothetical protein